MKRVPNMALIIPMMETQTKLIWDFRLKLHMTKILMTAIPNIKKFRENTTCNNIIDQNIFRLPHFRFRNITKLILAIKELPDIIMIIDDKNLQKVPIHVLTHRNK